MKHSQGRCPEPTETLRIAGDFTRAVHRLCAECRATYEAAPFSFTFVPASSPEWVIRATESRLPARVAA